MSKRLDDARFMAEIRGAAEGGAQIMPADVLRIFRIFGDEELERKRLEILLLEDPRPLSEAEIELARERIDAAVRKSKQRFCSFGHDGFELHETEGAAREAAAAELEACREVAPDGWPEDMEGIGWGRLEIVERVKAVERRPWTDADGAATHDEWVDYRLVPAGS